MLIASLSEAMTWEGIADSVLKHGMVLLGATGGCGALVDEARSGLDRLRVAGVPFSTGADGDPIALDDRSPMGESVQLCRAVVVEASAALRDVRSGADGAVLAVPLVVRGRVLGSLAWTWSAERSVQDEELETGLMLANLCGQALERIRLQAAEQRAGGQAEEAEQAWRQSEERFRSSFEQAAVGVMHCDAQSGRFLLVNPACSAITGYSREELLKKTWRDITHPDDLEADLSEARRALAGEIPSYRLEKRYVRKDGSSVWVDLFGTFVQNERDGSRYGVAIAVDISERKKAENDLRQRAEEVEKLMEVMPVAVWMSHDRDCRTIVGNRAGSALLRMETGDNLSKTAPAAEQPKHFGVFRNGRELRPEELPLQYAAAHGVRLCGVEDDIVFDDGTVRRVYGSVAPLFDQRGGVRGVVAGFLDVSELRRAERESLLSRDRLDLVVRSIEVGLWYCDLPFDKLVWNEKVKEHFGLPADYDVTIDTFCERLHPADRDRTRQAIEQSILDHTPYDVEYRTIGLDGQERWIRAIGRAFYDSAGKPLSFDGLTVNITERVRQQEALKEADRRKDEFLAVLAHELRNPLAPLRNALQILRASGNSPAAVEQTRAMMDRQLRQLVRLVDDLLDVSRITRGTIELRKERVDLAGVVQSAVEACRPLMESLKHDLTITLPTKPIQVNADATRLSQVFSNLLNNSAKYTPSGGRIGIAVEREGGTAVIRVRDNGIGIPTEALTRIFEMFTQVDRTLERSQGGLGIGLTLVKRLVELHDGAVGARSEGFGLGSEFLVRIPAFDELPVEDFRVSKDEDRAAEPEPGSRHRILVADDNEDAALSLCMMLELMGHQVHTVHDGQAAIRATEAFRPDVVLLDIGMPRLSGYEVAKQIRQLAEGKGVELIALTGWGQEEDRRRSKEAGFDHHLVKPIDLADLTKVSDRLRRREEP